MPHLRTKEKVSCKLLIFLDCTLIKSSPRIKSNTHLNLNVERFLNIFFLRIGKINYILT